MQKLKSGGEKHQLPDVLPALAVRDQIIFPGHTQTLFVGRDKSKAAVDKAVSSGNWILLCFQLDETTEYPNVKDLSDLGTVARILKKIILPDQRVRIMVEGIDRAKILEDYSNGDYLSFKIDLISENAEISEEILAEVELLDSLYIKYSELKPNVVGTLQSVATQYAATAELFKTISENLSAKITSESYPPTFIPSDMFITRRSESGEINAVRQHKSNPGTFADFVAIYCDFSKEEQMICLSKIKIEERVIFVYETLLKKLRKCEFKLNAEQRAKKKLETEYKNIFLQEQLSEILKEMGIVRLYRFLIPFSEAGDLERISNLYLY